MQALMNPTKSTNALFIIVLIVGYFTLYFIVLYLLTRQALEKNFKYSSSANILKILSLKDPITNLFVIYFMASSIVYISLIWSSPWCNQRRLVCMTLSKSIGLTIATNGILELIFFCISGFLVTQSLKFLFRFLKSLLSDQKITKSKTSQKNYLKFFFLFLILHLVVGFIWFFYTTSFSKEVFLSTQNIIDAINDPDVSIAEKQEYEKLLLEIRNYPELSQRQYATIKTLDLFGQFFVFIVGFNIFQYLIIQKNIFSKSDFLSVIRFTKFKLNRIINPHVFSQSVINDLFGSKAKSVHIIFDLPKILRALIIIVSIIIGIIWLPAAIEPLSIFLHYAFSEPGLETLELSSRNIVILFGLSGLIFSIVIPLALLYGLLSLWHLFRSSKPKVVNTEDAINEVWCKRRGVSNEAYRLTLEDTQRILILLERSLKCLNLKSSQCEDLEFERTQKTVNDFCFIAYWIIDSNLYSDIETTNQIMLAVGTACRIICEKLDVSSSSSTELSTKIYPLIVNRFDLNSYRWPRYKFHYQRYLVLGGKALVKSSQPERINHIEIGIKMLYNALQIQFIDQDIQKDYELNLLRLIYKAWTKVLIRITHPQHLDDKFLKFVQEETICLDLGKAYSSRVYGDIDENSQKAVKYLLKSHELSTISENLKLQNLVNLELSKIFLQEGKYQDIKLSKEMAKQLFISNAFSSNIFPEKWIDLCLILGQAYLALIVEHQIRYTLDLQDFIKNLFNSLFTFLDSKKQPRLWAKSKLILSDFYLHDNQSRQALEYALDAFKILDSLKEEFPIHWSEASGKLGHIYAALGDTKNAVLRFRESLLIFEPKYSPKECLKIAGTLGNLGYNYGNWEIAIEGYNQAILAIEQTRYWSNSEASKRALIANSLDIYRKMVEACINHQDYAQALLVVERSKSRTLTELLDSAHLYPKNATDEQKQRISDLRRQIAIYQQKLAFTPSDAATPATEQQPNTPAPQTFIRERLQSANQQLQDLLRELDDPTFTLTQQVPPQLPNLHRLLSPHTALIEWYLPAESESGFYLFFVTHRDDLIQITPHHFSASDRQLLDQALQDYRSDYGQDTWQDQLPCRLTALSAALHLSKIIVELSEIQNLILVPHRELHLIPFHALPLNTSGVESDSQCLQDRFPVQYAPSCQILNILQQRPSPATPSSSFFALQNPTQDLNHADFEVEVLRSLFNSERVLSHDAATKIALEQPQNRAFLQQSHHIHFSCHGEFNEDAPLNAYLRLAHQDKLTFQDIFTSFDIPNCRLLVLSACKTGLVETPPTDDYVGLASAFFFAGTRTVVGSLWEAEAFSSALLMIRFYWELPRHSSVVMALRAAQAWLRTTSRDGVLSWLQAELKLEDSELRNCAKELKLFNKSNPFALARYWAAFNINGRLETTGALPRHS